MSAESELPLPASLVKRILACEVDLAAMTVEERIASTPDDSLGDAIAQGLFSEADLMETCAPEAVELDRLDIEQPAYWVIKLRHEDGTVKELALRAGGVASFHPQWQNLPIKRIRQVLGVPDTTRIDLEWRTSLHAQRREEAGKLSPDIVKQFPKTKRSFDQLQATDWNREAIAQAKRWADSVHDQLRTGAGLGIRHRQTGSGKTALVCVAALTAVAQSGLHAYFAYCPDLFAGSYTEMDAAAERAMKTDLLVLDDIDAAVKPAPAPNDPDSSRSRQVLLRIVNWRYNQRLPILWTSNTAHEEEILYNVGDRTLRRLAERSHVLRFGDAAWDWSEHRSRSKA